MQQSSCSKILKTTAYLQDKLNTLTSKSIYFNPHSRQDFMTIEERHQTGESMSTICKADAQ